jgi:oligopeptide transport system ATP-binding protein
MTALLEVAGLSVTFRTDAGPVAAIEDVSFAIAPGETLALVGESSSGKSVTAMAIMRLLAPPPSCRIGGTITLDGRDLLTLPEPEMRRVRGGRIAMIFQEPMTSLNPVQSVGEQIAEAVREHDPQSAKAAWARAVELLDLVGIPDPGRRVADYPHRLSGGMRQRAMIAIALAGRPRLLIADEPTTALDVTIQAQILDLLRRLQRETGMAVLFITHNLGVVAEIADRVLVMYAGQVVEEAPVQALLRAPLMPYTTGLIGCIPRLASARVPGRRLAAIAGTIPDPRERPAGCTFSPRCPQMRADPCQRERPQIELATQAHRVRCARWREIAA